MTSFLNEKNEKFLELGRRKKIYEIVKKNEGCHYRELERLSKIPSGTLKYHLNFLVKKELLIEKKEHNNTRYFAKESNLSVNDTKLLSILRQKSLRNILLIFSNRKELQHHDIVDEVKLSPSTVSWHLSRLVEEKILEKKDSKYVLISDIEEIMKLLITYKESFFDNLVNTTIEMWELK